MKYTAYHSHKKKKKLIWKVDGKSKKEFEDKRHFNCTIIKSLYEWGDDHGTIESEIKWNEWINEDEENEPRQINRYKRWMASMCMCVCVCVAGSFCD